MVLDAQATAASRSRGALVEIGWAPYAASEGRELAIEAVTAHVVAPPAGMVLPPAVSRLTGLGHAEWARGIAPARVWERLERTAESVAPAPARVPLVIHFARFEEPFLRAMHERHGTGPLRFEPVCTHAIARRLLPELPRRTLRALAGYFGAAVPQLRRSADHVAATAFVWRELIALLAAREGIVGFAELGEWLSRPARRAPRRFPLPRERRLELPQRPGVYRFQRACGAVLYVGKAACLRQRVSGHFHARSGRDERTLEMLTQVRELSWSETETALEAALLETDEIKRLSPPYNVALAGTGRSLWFADRDLRELRPRPDRTHDVGPLASGAPFEALDSLRVVLAGGPPPSLAARARALGVEAGWAPGPECFAAGLARFATEHGSKAGTRELLALGSRLWSQRRAARATDAGASDEETGAASDPGPRPGWDAERVAHALEETVVRAAHAVRRARLLVRLSECCLAWADPGTEERRLLVVQGGALVTREYLSRGAPVPVPPGHARPAEARRTGFDLASFDRLRVLVTELRGLTGRGAGVELRLGEHAGLRGRRLRAALAAV